MLLVDDDVMVREALVAALRAHGLEVEAPASVEPADVLAAAEAFRPGIVLLDHHLGDHVGTALIEPLRALGATVLLLTGSTDPEVLGAALEAGAAGTLLKRQPMDDLLRAIDLAIDGHSVQRASERDELVATAKAAREERAQLLEPFQALTSREAAVLAGLLEGLGAEAIAERDFVSLPTIRTQIRAVLQKLGVTSQLAAVAEARRAGWVHHI